MHSSRHFWEVMKLIHISPVGKILLGHAFGGSILVRGLPPTSYFLVECWWDEIIPLHSWNFQCSCQLFFMNARGKWHSPKIFSFLDALKSSPKMMLLTTYERRPRSSLTMLSTYLSFVDIAGEATMDDYCSTDDRWPMTWWDMLCRGCVCKLRVRTSSPTTTDFDENEKWVISHHCSSNECIDLQAWWYWYEMNLMVHGAPRMYSLSRER